MRTNTLNLLAASESDDFREVHGSRNSMWLMVEFDHVVEWSAAAPPFYVKPS